MSLFSMTTHPVNRPALIHSASPEFISERRLFLRSLLPRGKSVPGAAAPGPGHAVSISGRTGHLFV